MVISISPRSVSSDERQPEGAGKWFAAQRARIQLNLAGFAVEYRPNWKRWEVTKDPKGTNIVAVYSKGEDGLTFNILKSYPVLEDLAYKFGAVVNKHNEPQPKLAYPGKGGGA